MSLANLDLTRCALAKDPNPSDATLQSPSEEMP
jgi:hypothetical protein